MSVNVIAVLARILIEAMWENSIRPLKLEDLFEIDYSFVGSMDMLC